MEHDQQQSVDRRGGAAEEEGEVEVEVEVAVMAALASAGSVPSLHWNGARVCFDILAGLCSPPSHVSHSTNGRNARARDESDPCATVS